MDIGHIHGLGGVDRTGGDRSRGQGVDGRAEAHTRPATADSAAISATGRDTLEAVEVFTERARQGEDRTEVVAQAKARLEAGELASPEAFDGAARNMLLGGF